MWENLELKEKFSIIIFPLIFLIFPTILSSFILRSYTEDKVIYSEIYRNIISDSTKDMSFYEDSLLHGYCAIKSVLSINHLTCQCGSLWFGKTCERYYKCHITPCENGGTCFKNEGDNKECECKTGTLGANCETNTNECASNPCQYNGKCIDKINRFECICAKGFSGLLCENAPNGCESNPCQNDGTCVSNFLKYFCVCELYYYGRECENVTNFVSVNKDFPRKSQEYYFKNRISTFLPVEDDWIFLVANQKVNASLSRIPQNFTYNTFTKTISIPATQKHQIAYSKLFHCVLLMTQHKLYSFDIKLDKTEKCSILENTFEKEIQKPKFSAISAAGTHIAISDYNNTIYLYNYNRIRVIKTKYSPHTITYIGQNGYIVLERKFQKATSKNPDFFLTKYTDLFKSTSLFKSFVSICQNNARQYNINLCFS